MAIRTITLTIELDDEQQDYEVALSQMVVAERQLRKVFRDRADIRVMEFSREANP